MLHITRCPLGGTQVNMKGNASSRGGSKMQGMDLNLPITGGKEER